MVGMIDDDGDDDVVSDDDDEMPQRRLVAGSFCSYFGWQGVSVHTSVAPWVVVLMVYRQLVLEAWVCRLIPWGRMTC